MDRKNLTRLLAAALALSLLSSCYGNTGYSSESAASQTADAGENGNSEEALFSTIDTDENGTDSSGTDVSVPNTAEQSAEQSADTSREPTADPTEVPTAETSGTADPETSVAEISVGSSESSQTSEPANPVQTEQPSQPSQPSQPAQTEQTEQTTKPPQTEQTAKPKPPKETEKPVEPDEPVDVVIPDVKIPLSPGVETASSEKAVLDYSNASEGYISVCRKSSEKAMKLRIIFGEKTYDHDVGEGEEYFPLSCGSGTYKVQLYENTEGKSFAKLLEQDIEAKIKPETSPFVYPNKYVNYDSGSNAVRKSAELCAGKTDVIEKLAAIFQWITDNVTYDTELAEKVKKGQITEYVPDPDSVLKKKIGICYDYASLFAAMARTQGIPTRLVKGYAAPDIYHAWNEVYTEETGWITPELLLSKHGYNILDSTFYAGSSNKEKIAEYISDSGNYSALYYY